MKIQKVGVAGCGLMGSGIAEVAAKGGFDVLVREVDERAVEAGRGRIEGSLARALKREKITAEDRDEVLGRVRFTTEIEALADRDIVIEAVIEELAVKNELFGTLDGLCPDHTIFATNTSSLTVSEMAAAVERPDRVVGLHFFNPVPVMKLVEVVRTIATSDETWERSQAFARALGKEPITAGDRSGFVVNLLLVPYMLDAIRQLERGVASIEDIDKGMVLGYRYPIGPLRLGDLVGHDVRLGIAEYLASTLGPRFEPPQLLRDMVAEGKLGKKSGQGFFAW